MNDFNETLMLNGKPHTNENKVYGSKNPMLRVAAIHDLSGFGRCALTVVIPVMSAMGIQVCPLPTAILSTHSGGFDGFTFQDLTEGMKPYAAHWKSLGIDFDCIYSGFLGSLAQIATVAQFIDDFGSCGRQLVVVDPVMGDDGVLYKTYTLKMQEEMKRLVKKANVVTPNYTEACFLTGGKYSEAPVTIDIIKKMLCDICDIGPEMAVITNVRLEAEAGMPLQAGLRLSEIPGAEKKHTKLPSKNSDNGKYIALNAGYTRMDDRYHFIAFKPVTANYPGTGDLFASVLTGNLMKGCTLEEAMKKATEFVSYTAALTYSCSTPEREGVMLERALHLLAGEAEASNGGAKAFKCKVAAIKEEAGVPLKKPGISDKYNPAEAFSRTAMLIGEGALEKLKGSTVAVFGVGGVGSHAADALARCGVGKLVLIDYDNIEPSNINRQVHATAMTVGKLKAEVMKERILEINPDAEVTALVRRYRPGDAEGLVSCDYDYIIDAIDDVAAKTDLIAKAKEAGVPVISSMGTGNKLDPSQFEVADIYSTSVCPLARVMRKELKKRGVGSLKVVYSKEEPAKVSASVPGSISFVPPVAGLILAGEVVRELMKM